MEEPDEDDHENEDMTWGMTVEYIRRFNDDEIEDAIETLRWAIEEDFWID